MMPGAAGYEHQMRMSAAGAIPGGAAIPSGVPGLQAPGKP